MVMVKMKEIKATPKDSAKGNPGSFRNVRMKD
jgi:hypothetical protein